MPCPNPANIPLICRGITRFVWKTYIPEFGQLEAFILLSAQCDVNSHMPSLIGSTFWPWLVDTDYRSAILEDQNLAESDGVVYPRQRSRVPNIKAREIA